MAPTLLWILGLLQGARSEGPETLFVQTGSDVTLVPDVPSGFDFLQWEFEGQILGTSGEDGLIFFESERCELHPHNSSVTLKNLKQEHSGLYAAAVVHKHHFYLSVQDPVSPVELNLSSVSSSSESCSFTVSCTTELYSISRSFTCDTHSCEEPRPQTPGHTPSGHTPSLHLYLSDQSIICNHSNHVSWTNGTTDIPQECVFRRTGSRTSQLFIPSNHDLLLDVPEERLQKHTDLFEWKCDGSSILRVFERTISVGQKYEKRVEFFQSNLSLVLKSVRLSDSGIYTAEHNKGILAQFVVTVQDPEVKNSTKIQNCRQICTDDKGPEEVLGWSVCRLKTLVYCVGLLLMLSALITVHVLEHRTKQD